MAALGESLTGKRFGRLVVHEAHRIRPKALHYRCLCDCGNTKLIGASELRRGCTVSCGCQKLESARLTNRTHGQSKTPEYRCWAHMIGRCCTPTESSYHRYGGRGITVCDRWRNSFENFQSDMGPRPSLRHSIERKDNDGPYSPENCYWGTVREQSNNRRDNIHLTWNGVTKPLSIWAEEIGVSQRTLYGRLKRGYSHSEALSNPYKKRCRSGKVRQR